MRENFRVSLCMLLGGLFLFIGTSFAGESETVSAVTNATNEKPSPWAVNVWGLSRHPGGSSELNNKNAGLGFRRYHSEHWFSDVNCMRNSLRGVMCTAGTGLEYELLKLGMNTSLLAGGGVFLLAYQIPEAHKTLYAPMVAPIIGVRHNNTSLNLAIVPALKHGDDGERKIGVAVITLFLTIRF